MDVDTSFAPRSLFDRVSASMPMPQQPGVGVRQPVNALTFSQMAAPKVAGIQPDVDEEMLLHEMSALGDGAVLDTHAQDELMMDRLRAMLDGSESIPVAKSVDDAVSTGGGNALSRSTDYISASTLCIDQETKGAAMRAANRRKYGAPYAGASRAGQPTPAGSSAEVDASLPLVGTATTGYAVDPVVSSLRQERQLWRLFGLLLGGYVPAQLQAADAVAAVAAQEGGSRQAAGIAGGAGAASPFLPGASLPADAVAHSSALARELGSSDPIAALASTLADWTEVAAADDAPRGLLDGLHGQGQKGKTPSLIASLLHRSKDSSLQPSHADEWCVALDGHGYVVMDGAAVGGSASGIDGIGASSAGAGVGASSKATPASNELHSAVWAMVRCGLMDQALDLCSRTGNHALAAVLLATRKGPGAQWGDEATDAAGDAGGDDDGMGGSGAGAGASSSGAGGPGQQWSRGGNPFLPLTRRAARAAARAVLTSSSATVSAAADTPALASLLLLGAGEKGVVDMLRGVALGHTGAASAAGLASVAPGASPNAVCTAGSLATWEDALWCGLQASIAIRTAALEGQLRASQDETSGHSALPHASPSAGEAASAEIGTGVVTVPIRAAQASSAASGAAGTAASAAKSTTTTTSLTIPLSTPLDVLALLEASGGHLSSASTGRYAQAVKGLMALATAAVPPAADRLAAATSGKPGSTDPVLASFYDRLTPVLVELVLGSGNGEASSTALGLSLPYPGLRCLALPSLSSEETTSVQAGKPSSPAAALTYAAAFNASVPADSHGNGNNSSGNSSSASGAGDEPSMGADSETEGLALLGPLSPDALPTTARPLAPAQVPLLRWVAMALLLLRSASPLAGHPVVAAMGLSPNGGGAGATGAAGSAGASTGTGTGTGTIRQVPGLPHPRLSAVLQATDDVLYSYGRHLACSVPRTAHVSSVLQLCRLMTSRARAVRALVAYLLALPYAGPLADASSYGGVQGLLSSAAGAGKGSGLATGHHDNDDEEDEDMGGTGQATVASVPPRATLWAAIRTLVERHSMSASSGGDRVPAALRLAVLTAITMDGGTVADCATRALEVGISHAGWSAIMGAGHGAQGQASGTVEAELPFSCTASPGEAQAGLASPDEGLAVLGVALPYRAGYRGLYQQQHGEQQHRPGQSRRGASRLGGGYGAGSAPVPSPSSLAAHGGLPLAARAVGLSLVDFLRVTSLQLLTGGSTTGLLPSLLDHHAVTAANALSRLLLIEATAAEEAAAAGGGNGQGADSLALSVTGASSPAAAAAGHAALARSAWAALRLLHSGLGPVASSAADPASRALAVPMLPHSVAASQASAATMTGAPDRVVQAAAELAAWQALVSSEGTFEGWRDTVARGLPAPPPELAQAYGRGGDAAGVSSAGGGGAGATSSAGGFTGGASGLFTGLTSVVGSAVGTVGSAVGSVPVLGGVLTSLTGWGGSNGLPGSAPGAAGSATSGYGPSGAGMGQGQSGYNGASTGTGAFASDADTAAVAAQRLARARSLHQDLVLSRWGGSANGGAAGAVASGAAAGASSSSSGGLKATSAQAIASLLQVLAPGPTVTTASTAAAARSPGAHPSSLGWLPGDQGALLLVPTDPIVTTVAAEEGHGIPPADAVRSLAVQRALGQLQLVVDRTTAWVSSDPLAAEVLGQELEQLLAPAKAALGQVQAAGTSQAMAGPLPPAAARLAATA